MSGIKIVPLERLKSKPQNDSIIEICSTSEDEVDEIRLPIEKTKQMQNKPFHIVLSKLPSVKKIIETHNLEEIRDERNNLITESFSEFQVKRGNQKPISGEYSSDDDKKSDPKMSVFEDDEEDERLRSAMKVKKKRKRIVQTNDSSEDDSNHQQKENKENHEGRGRKNIRKFKGSESLEENTKRAAKEEKRRLERLAERQKVYNSLMYDVEDKITTNEQNSFNKLLLDFDEETKETLLEVDAGIVKHLKPHQRNGIKFMWEACFESISQMKKSPGSGCILAHCMGLGKTLQVVGLVHTLLASSELTNVQHILVVSPLSTVLNWAQEFEMWCSKANKFKSLDVYELSKAKQNVERAYRIKEWLEDGGIMIMGYEMFRNLSNIGKKLRKKLRDDVYKALLDPGPDLIICDEGHLLKNEKTSISKAMSKIKTLRRIVLTGTPLQNNLKEYYCMVQFVKPNLLGSYKEYLNRFVNPITNGQYCDSTDLDIKIMKRRSHVLHNMLEGCVQRRDYSVLAPFLPKKHEYVLFIKLTDLQIKLYKFYMEHRPAMDTSKKAATIFQDFQNLQRIWTHPRVLRYNSDNYEKQMAKKELEVSDSEGSLREFINDSDEDSEGQSSSSDDNEEAQLVGTRMKTRKMVSEDPETVVEVIEEKRENPTEWWMQMVSEEDLDETEHSSKLSVLFSILQLCEDIGDKLLVFSQSLYSLDVIEHFLSLIDEKTQNEKNPEKLKFSGSWALGIDYFRLDGSTSVENRSLFCSMFNDEANSRARLFLISTRAGGLGINLVAANRVVVFDVSWNPSHDIQSIFRIYRFGQKKPCYVYRFVALGTMEEKIYERQVTKEAISKRVIDEQQIDRHYKEKDILELYTTDLEPEKPKETPMLPKDRLFADVLTNQSQFIYRYHEHDSLLENKEEETLDEEERKAAWEDYNLEKEKRYPTFTQNSVSGLGQKGYNGGPAASSLIFGIPSNVMLMLLQLKIRSNFPYYSQMQVNQSVPLLMQELYRQMNNGEVTLYNELLELRSAMISSVQQAGPSNRYQPSTYATPNQISQYQQSWNQPPRPIDPNEIVEID